MDRGIFNIGSFISIYSNRGFGKTDYKSDQHGISLNSHFILAFSCLSLMDFFNLLISSNN